jgi:hypothetical protein
MSLASLLPYDHPYAGGYPGIGSQPLPTDADAIDYLSRMATADGAGVEVGVATAVDAFVRDAKELGVFSALKACCILSGARTLAGALVPVVGDAPTPNGFVSGDYSRTAGLSDPGATAYLDSGRAGNADPQNDSHLAVYATAAATSNTPGGDAYAGVGGNGAGAKNIIRQTSGALEMTWRINNALGQEDDTNNATGLIAASRGASTSLTGRASGTDYAFTVNSDGTDSNNIHLFQINWATTNLTSNPTLAFYSIGTSLSLEALDIAVTNLINAIGEAL